ncbi:unnamed protein product [Litomosoides sigmodontis]|uniref:Glutaredoxin domain-containing protein n=1 Tax=Litomosoides sigmodontis TaxID=42156 RepID=A0A3P6TQT7_LITSI|nr:unnamed protein product [Litomosoides sigmodontis]VDM92356.1 unnamed protein product [Litomosoides sigmodontis]
MPSQLFLSILFMLQFHHIIGSNRYNVEWYLEKIIQNHQVVLFSKTHCSYSARLKYLIQKYNIRDKRVIELNLEPDMELMQDYLKRRNGGIRTVPQLYLNGKFIGNFDIIQRKERSGELARIFAQAGITPRKSLLALRKRKCSFN